MSETRIVSSALVTAARYDPPAQTFYGAVYDNAARICDGSLRPYTGAMKHGDPCILDERPTHKKVFDKATYLGRFHAHFGHFLLETLPALSLAADTDERCILHPWPEGFREECISAGFRGFFLSAIGMRAEQISLAVDPILVGELRIPQFDRALVGDAGSTLFTCYRRIRNYAVAQTDYVNQHACVYLSRAEFSGGSKRNILNESVVENLFRSRGFSVIYPETLSAQEQVGIVANADIVAGVDGSAMHLCGFMRQGARVVMIETRPQRAFTAVNVAMGLSTYALRDCIQSGSPDGQFLIDVKSLEMHLKRILPVITDEQLAT